MNAVEVLKELGFRVEEAVTAVEALNKVRLADGRIDAALIDVGLPDRRGDSLAAELRAMYSQMPIVIASGHGRSEEHPSELQSLMRLAYAVFCLKKNKNTS